jgi:hypothetical protein
MTQSNVGDQKLACGDCGRRLFRHPAGSCPTIRTERTGGNAIATGSLHEMQGGATNKHRATRYGEREQRVAVHTLAEHRTRPRHGTGAADRTARTPTFRLARDSPQMGDVDNTPVTRKWTSKMPDAILDVPQPIRVLWKPSHEKSIVDDAADRACSRIRRPRRSC